MNCSFDLTNSLIALASVVSAAAAYAAYRVSKSILNLQQSSELRDQPQVHFWIQTDMRIIMINIGQRALAVCKLRVLEGLRSKSQQMVNSKLQRSLSNNSKIGSLDEVFSEHLVILPNILHLLTLDRPLPQLTIEILYHNGKFDFVELDSARAGGTYVLDGKTGQL